MRRIFLILLGVLLVAAVAVALLPLSWVTGRYLPGLEAEAVSGTIWNGRIRAARYQGVPIGDVEAGLVLQPLLKGEAEIGWTRLEQARGDRLAGRATLSRGLGRVSDVSGTVTLPVPVGGVSVLVALEGVTVVTDRRGRCRAVSGDVTATVAGLPMIGALPPLGGQPRCDGEAFHAPLGLADGSIGLDLRLWPARRWEADLALRQLSPLIVGLLELAGFRRTEDGVAIRTGGTLSDA
jgi:general secretion pathway protein N